MIGDIIKETRETLRLGKTDFARLLSTWQVKPIRHTIVIKWETMATADERLYYRMYYLAHETDNDQVRQMAEGVMRELQKEISPAASL